jgi:hypothetical protein
VWERQEELAQVGGAKRSKWTVTQGARQKADEVSMESLCAVIPFDATSDQSSESRGRMPGDMSRAQST